MGELLTVASIDRFSARGNFIQDKKAIKLLHRHEAAAIIELDQLPA
ncbi:MAG: hypothetical protein ACI95C_001168 [Pseudohongiellaceae bacterium]|jgi:hypothetical protein